MHQPAAIARMNFASGDRKYTQTYLRGRVKVAVKGSRTCFNWWGVQLSRNWTGIRFNLHLGRSLILKFTHLRLFSKHCRQNASIMRMNNLKGIDQEVQNLSGIGYRAFFWFRWITFIQSWYNKVCTEIFLIIVFHGQSVSGIKLKLTPKIKLH